jgi:hypothetical protein
MICTPYGIKTYLTIAHPYHISIRNLFIAYNTFYVMHLYILIDIKIDALNTLCTSNSNEYPF